MKITLSPKRTKRLLPTDILFQTLYWARVKSRLGHCSLAFDIYCHSSDYKGDVLVLLQAFGKDLLSAYIPQGPEYAPQMENYGVFLEELSESLERHLDPGVAFIRYDLPWKSRYSWEIRQQKLKTYPEPRIREMRMNMGTRSWNLRKASMDMTVASTLVVDIEDSEKQILDRMKPKTRYNIGLAQRKGVKVNFGSLEHLPAFYDLYLQTSKRNRFSVCSYDHFAALFEADFYDRGNCELMFLLATHKDNLLAGAIVAVSGNTAHFLYGASSNEHRNLMGSYALHWEAIKQARLRSCVRYDMGAISPTEDTDHPFHGLYRFKTGFGGKIEVRSGSWDYPLDEQKYHAFANADILSRGPVI